MHKLFFADFKQIKKPDNWDKNGDLLCLIFLKIKGKFVIYSGFI